MNAANSSRLIASAALNHTLSPGDVSVASWHWNFNGRRSASNRWEVMPSRTKPDPNLPVLNEVKSWEQGVVGAITIWSTRTAACKSLRIKHKIPLSGCQHLSVSMGNLAKRESPLVRGNATYIAHPKPQ